MRALLVYATEGNTGLSSKAEKIADGFRSAGYDVDTICFTSNSHKGVRFYEWLKVNSVFLYSVLRIRYDVVYARYAYYFGLMYVMAWVLRCPLQIEVNSNVREELLQRGHVLRATVDQFIMWIAFHTSNRLHVVTKQLKQLYQATYPKADIVFNPNFVVSEQMPSNRILGEGSVVNLVFLGDASQPWHGIEKFIQRIVVENQWFAKNCCLHLVGQSTAQIDNLITRYGLHDVVKYHGFLTGDAKARVLGEMDVGIGCFDLAVKGLTEATPIKNGEYLHSGLALLLGYEDSVCPSELPFVGKVLLDDGHARECVEVYLHRIRSIPDLRTKAHDYARRHMLVKKYIDKIIAC